MVSRATVKALVDETEAKYEKCWETLSRLRKPESPAGADLFEDILKFQPTLARALYDLSEMYRTLHQEKRTMVAKKERLSPEWFKKRLKTLDGYQEVLKAVLTIGKRLGDAFAWLFYRRDRGYLPAHHKHEGQLHLPPGVGGLGELKFIENVRMVKGHLVLYHGITTFLRVGDVSFINLEDMSLTAVGELKTKQVAVKELSITIEIIGPKKETMLLFEDARANPAPERTDDGPTSLPLPQNIRAKLNRQMTSIGESFKLPDPNIGMDLESEYHIGKLETFCKELKPSSFTFKKIGDGLLMAGIRIRKRTLSSKIMGPYRVNLSERIHGVEEETQRILDKESTENELWISSFNDATSEYRLTPGMVPLFWWPLDLGVIRGLLFHDAFLFSVYNPAHLIAKLRGAGFEVEFLKGQRGLKVEKTLGDKTIAVENFTYFIHLVTEQFFDEKAVVESLVRFSERAESEAVPPFTRVEMQIE